MYAKKSLGQHFLTSEGAVGSILDASDITEDDTVLEIGPGKGVLTSKLVSFAGKVIAVEKDRDLIPILSEKFKKEIKKGKLKLLEQDILEFEPESLKLEAPSYKLVANIPYYITGQLIRKFLESTFQPERMVLMVQKEVAERIVAKDNKESVLSISVKAYGTPHYVQTVKAGSFFPIPNVDSAILLIDSISKDFFRGFSEADFFTMLKAGFKSKRKKLSSNLLEIADKEKIIQAFEKRGLSDNIRAEDVSFTEWQKLAEEILI
ncbi:16S rRNA (adenine(1518)-N(6)/adenine(1519)-N(6))-dimethyltransferaseRsmA [soil metagenome]